MNSNDLNEMNAIKADAGFMRFFRVAGLIGLIIGVVVPLAFMFREGQNSPRFLLVLFTFWVLSPFAALFWAYTVSKRWSLVTRATLYCVALIVALSSLVIYSGLINVKPAGSANAFLFVAVPPVSVLFFIIVVPIAAFISSRLTRRVGN